MKIASTYFPQIRINFANKTNLRFNNVLYTDVFEESGISFGKSNKNISKRTLTENLGFSDEQADVIISHRFNNGQHYQKIKNFLEQGFEFDSVIKILKNISSDIRITKDESVEEAIKSYYLKNPKDIEKYEALSQDSELDVVDKISVITYELNGDEIERYKTLDSSSFEIYERLLVAKFGLDDDEIRSYISQRGESIPLISHIGKVKKYVPTADELMYCIKKHFNMYELIKFVGAKNATVSMLDKTVRKSGGIQLLRVDSSAQLAIQNRTSNDYSIYEHPDYLMWLFKQKGNLNGKNFNMNLQYPTNKLVRKIINSNISYDDKIMLIKGISASCKAQYSAKNKIITELPKDFWYSTGMGCKEETFKTMQEAINSIEQNSVESSPIASDDFSEKFNIKLSQAAVDGKPILIVTNKGEVLPRYIAYNGAIAPVKQVRQYDDTQFSAWGNIESQKQAQILAKAASSFPFDLFDERGVCIIGNGKDAPKFDVKQSSDAVIKGYYCGKFLDLKKAGKLNAQEILKLMPKDCMLSINPYIQDGGMLYSIVCEWISADNTRLQIEIHSQDTKWHSDNEWIFRFGEEKDGVRKYFRIADDNSSYDFKGEFLDNDSHIKIDSPLKNDDLLNSVEFQRVIKQMSADLYADFEIDEIVNKLGVTGMNEDEKKYNLVDYCLKNPLAFAKYKDEILKLRASIGMLELV